jgi:hypothetical protein
LKLTYSKGKPQMPQGEKNKTDDPPKSKAAGAGADFESAEPGRTPGSAEGDRETVEEDIKDKLGDESNDS